MYIARTIVIYLLSVLCTSFLSGKGKEIYPENIM